MAGESGGAAEGEEELLEVASRRGGSGRVIVESGQEPVGSAMAGLRSCQRIEGEHAAQSQVLRAVEQALDSTPVERGGEVEDRPRRRRHRDAARRAGLAVER